MVFLGVMMLIPLMALCACILAVGPFYLLALITECIDERGPTIPLLVCVVLALIGGVLIAIGIDDQSWIAQ